MVQAGVTHATTRRNTTKTRFYGPLFFSVDMYSTLNPHSQRWLCSYEVVNVRFTHLLFLAFFYDIYDQNSLCRSIWEYGRNCIWLQMSPTSVYQKFRLEISSWQSGSNWSSQTKDFLPNGHVSNACPVPILWSHFWTTTFFSSFHRCEHTNTLFSSFRRSLLVQPRALPSDMVPGRDLKVIQCRPTLQCQECTAQ